MPASRLAVVLSALALGVAASAAAEVINTAPVATAPFFDGPVFFWDPLNGGNGHYYAFVDASVDWQTALALAAAESHLGHAGYLATIGSAAEDSFITQTVAGGALAWVAGSDDGDEGNWTWRAGPEAGQAFSYTNWAPGEPNNCCNGENFLHVNWGAGGSWNDHGGPGNPGQLNGYLIEFSAPPVPEPASLGLWMLGLGLGGVAVRRKLALRS